MKAQLMGVLWVCLVIGSMQATAATATWSVDSNGNFSTGSNWGGAVPSTTGDDVVFSSVAFTASRTVTVDSAWSTSGSVSSILLNSTSASNFSLSGSGITSFSIGSGGVTNNSASRTLTFNSSLPITLASNQTWTTSASSSKILVNSTISGAYSLTLNGTGSSSSFEFAGNNTYSGGTTLSAGILTISNNNALGSGTVTINGGTIRCGGSNAYSLNNNFIIGSYFGIGSTASNYGSLTLAGGMDLGSSTRVITVSNSSSGDNIHTFSGVISGTGGMSVTASSSPSTYASTLILTGVNTYSGKTSVSGGATLEFNSVANVNGGASALGSVTSSSNGLISLGATSTSGVLKYVGSVDSATDRIVDFSGTTGGGVINASGLGSIKFTSASTATGAGVKTVTLTGSSTASNEFYSIANGGGTTSLVKSGSGTWWLTGNSTFTGTTSITGGALYVSGSLDSSSAVSISSGAVLGGNGIVGGTVTTAANTSMIDPNGTFSLGSLDASSGVLLNINLGTDEIAITGSMSGSNSDDDLLLRLSGGTSGSVYTLLTFTTANGLESGDFALDSNSIASGYILDTSFGDGGILVNANSVDVKILVAGIPEPSTWVMVLSGLLLVIAIHRKSSKRLIASTLLIISTAYLSEAAEPLRVLYLRHAEGGHNIEKAWHAQNPDAPKNQWPPYILNPSIFTPKGMLQIEEITEKLGKYKIDFVACSPLPRCQDSILPTLKKYGLKAEIWKELIEGKGAEINPSSERKIVEIVVNEKEASYFTIMPDEKKEVEQPQGTEEMKKLAQSAKKKLLSRFSNTEKTILLVGHSLSGSVLIEEMTGIPKCFVKNAEIAEMLQSSEDKFTLVALNGSEWKK